MYIHDARMGETSVSVFPLVYKAKKISPLGRVRALQERNIFCVILTYHAICYKYYVVNLLQIMDWTRGKEKNIRALLSSLGDVLWDGETRWPKPGIHLMVEPSQVKKMYRNASRVVHPDKVINRARRGLFNIHGHVLYMY